MRNQPLFLLALSSQAIAGDWKIHKRKLTITSTVYSTTYFCPCSTFPPLPSSSTSSTGVNSESIGMPLLTSAPVTSTSSIMVPSINAVPSSFTSTPSVASLSTSSAPGSGGTVFVSAASLGDYQTSILASHNVHRVNHTAPNLVWSPTMAQHAAQIAGTCVYAHSKAAGDGNYGQNIGAGFTPGQIAFMITNAMYNGEMTKFPGPYGQDSIDTSTFGGWGHFSQIVWADTLQVGCATQFCPGGLANAGPNTPPYFTVCNYFPPGNFLGQWSKVHAPIGGASVVVVN